MRISSLLPSLMLPLALLGGCHTERREERAPMPSAQPVHGDATRAWRVLDGQRAAGFVVRFDERGPSARSFYSVRNPLQQELGMIDSLGRAWRFRLFAEEPDWVHTGSVLDGARTILELSAAARMEEIALGELGR